MDAHTEEKNFNHSCVSIVPIFNKLEHEELTWITELSHSKRFKKNEFILQPLDSYNHLYIIHTGKVKVFRMTESGNEQLTRLLVPGDFMGELALFSEITNDSFAEALSDTEVCMIQRSDFQKILLKHPSTYMKVIEELSRRLDRAEKQVIQLNTQDVEIRLASFIIELSKVQETLRIILPTSKKDLASYLGTTQETMSRKLSTLESKKIIKRSGQRNIHILDLQALQQIVDAS